MPNIAIAYISSLEQLEFFKKEFCNAHQKRLTSNPVYYEQVSPEWVKSRFRIAHEIVDALGFEPPLLPYHIANFYPLRKAYLVLFPSSHHDIANGSYNETMNYEFFEEYILNIWNSLPLYHTLFAPDRESRFMQIGKGVDGNAIICNPSAPSELRSRIDIHSYIKEMYQHNRAIFAWRNFDIRWWG